MIKVNDEHNVLYKYGLEKYWKDVEDRIHKDFPDCNLNITISTEKIVTNSIYMINIECNGFFKIKQKEDDIKLEYVSMAGKATSFDKIEINTYKTKKTYYNNLYVVLLILKSIFRREENYGVPTEYTDIDIPQIKKYFVCNLTRETHKETLMEVFPNTELDIASAIKFELFSHYDPFCADNLYTLTKLEYEPFIRNDPLKEELVKKAVTMVVDTIFNTAEASGIPLTFLESYDVSISEDKSKLVIKFDIDNKIVKSVSFEADYHIHGFAHIINPKKQIAHLLLNFYVWYTAVIDTTTSDEDHSIFKDAIMSNIDVNV